MMVQVKVYETIVIHKEHKHNLVISAGANCDLTCPVAALLAVAPLQPVLSFNQCYYYSCVIAYLEILTLSALYLYLL
ncbi:unnamed protein product [Sphenostylis stenocarpa]|uniref:Uncharacterized protein n=1 Tax=Sphenostylis stenocarpa TaxID=92480 RepID=A0AA86RZ18_9FABA|nr:unnamed protein product [Sphenostylis stenocarpa]